MAQKEPVYVSLEFTPNPNTLKYSVNRELLPRGAINFSNAAEVKGRSPLADLLFQINGILAVMVGKDFVTITKSEDGDWDLVHKGASELIDRYLTADRPAVTGELASAPTNGKLSEVEKKILEVIEEEIRPAVAMDGGDITFDRYEDGVVYLYMQGSCAGCPSSTATLKMGIERRLQEEVPEIREVVAI